MGPTSKTGNISIAAVTLALVECGIPVYAPVGDGYRADLMIEIGDQVIRLQVKTARVRRGAVRFSPKSVAAGPNRVVVQHYRGQIDYFAAYCPDTRKTYLIAVNDVPMSVVNLRLDPAISNQQKRIRWAANFEIAVVLAKIIAESPQATSNERHRYERTATL
jgi:hypothetical protein